MKRFFSKLVLALFITSNFGFVSLAAAPNVVINEVAWAGSSDSSGDEWIELYNPGNVAVDLSGWTIQDDGAPQYVINSGVIEARGYFVIGDTEDVAGGQIDTVIGLSLANTGDSLELFDALGVSMDAVNVEGTLWPAGNLTSKASMERIDPLVAGSEAGNWASATVGNGSVASAGAAILGTPGSANSVFEGGAIVSVSPGEVFADAGDVVNFSVGIQNAADVYAYGLDLIYDANALEFVNISEGEFLKSDGAGTSFNSGLEGGEAGALVVGGARLISPPAGVDGEGELFNVSFKVTGADGAIASIAAGPASFVADSLGDVPTGFVGASLEVGGSAGGVSGLALSEGAERRSLMLSWVDDGAESYIVKRQMPDTTFESVWQGKGASYEDSGLAAGVEYVYQVFAVRGTSVSAPAEVSGVEQRGLIGDVDMSDRIDGRDIEQLARSYGAGYGEEAYILGADVNYDGVIDGSDLIDIGINFGLVY